MAGFVKSYPTTCPAHYKPKNAPIAGVLNQNPNALQMSDRVFIFFICNIF